MSTAEAVRPTPEQLREYAEKLPTVYRDVLTAFVTVDPHRRYGAGLPTSALRNHLNPDGLGFWNDDELSLALDNLTSAGFLTEGDRVGWYAPTPVGEELLAAVTGKRARRVVVPELPKPTW